VTRIYYTKPSITDLETRYATDAAANGWGEHCYDYVVRFERLFAAHVGVPHALATSSCTGALHMGLAALGIGPGDEVILADINWIATAAPITYLGAKPVLVDVRRDTWCIDSAAAERAITPRTKAIIATHIYGNLCDMDALLDLGRSRHIPIVEDAAEAIGSVWRGRRAGSMGAFGTFSFHGTKTITTGEGGMLVTSDPNLFRRVRTLANHGRSADETRQFWPAMIGFKYKMANVQAAIGCAQMERVDELIERKRSIFLAYRERLSTLPLSMNPEPAGTVNGFWMPTMVADPRAGFDRQAVLTSFKAAGIDGRVFFWPLSSLPMFEGHPRLPVAADLAPRGLNLPTYHNMQDEDIERVCQVLVDHLRSAR
jgi:perosamine synthetase